VDTENLGSNYGSNGKTVKDIYERLPRLDVATAFALVIEAIHCVYSLEKDVIQKSQNTYLV